MFRTLLALLVFMLSLASTEAQVVNGVTLVEPSLISPQSAANPGKPFLVGLRLKIAPGWHTYWLNPGDSGIPVSIQWKLPPSWKAGPIRWPIPEKHLEPGNMITFGYENEVLLITEITPPDDAKESRVTLEAEASWLVCESTCVPGSAELKLEMPVSIDPPASTEYAALFAETEAKLPKSTAPPFKFRWENGDTEAFLKLEGTPVGATYDFYPTTAVLRYPEVVSPGVIRVPFPPPPEPAAVQGILVQKLDGKTEAWLLDSRRKNTPAEAVTTSSAAAAPPSTPPAPPPGEVLTLPKALGFGFIGGFILNLMPCVLPVIALKIFGFIGQVGESRQRVFRMGLAFVGGIFAWFIALAVLVLIARNAGHEVNWAFQFQNPKFVLGMAMVVFIFSLNLLGVFEIWLPGTSKLTALSSKEGYGGAFMHGVLATLLATPCTAPFLAPALAFAFAQSGVVTFAMFLSIAMGMSLPYILLTANPGWMKFLPRPGNWMIRLKQTMGFFLLGTVVWLFSILASHDAKEAIQSVWLFLGVGMACWIFGNWITPNTSLRYQTIALGAILAVLGISFQLANPTHHQNGVDQWEPWSPERVQELVAQRKPIFVDFTADWCTNCKYNEKFVLDTEPVRKALAGYTTLKADWTKNDPVITAELKRLGRAGVPVYLVYPPDGSGQPKILPEILTQNVVIDALK